MGIFEVKGFKAFSGMECEAFSATLHYKGKPAIKLEEAGYGGPMRIEFINTSDELLELIYAECIKCMEAAATRCGEGLDIHGKSIADTYREELAATPPEVFKASIRKHDGDASGDYMCLAIVMARYVDEHNLLKTLKRWCKTKIVFTDGSCKAGSYRIIKQAYDRAVDEPRLKAKFGADIEIINNRFLS